MRNDEIHYFISYNTLLFLSLLIRGVHNGRISFFSPFHHKRHAIIFELYNIKNTYTKTYNNKLYKKYNNKPILAFCNFNDSIN